MWKYNNKYESKYICIEQTCQRESKIKLKKKDFNSLVLMSFIKEKHKKFLEDSQERFFLKEDT